MTNQCDAIFNMLEAIHDPSIKGAGWAISKKNALVLLFLIGGMVSKNDTPESPYVLYADVFDAYTSINKSTESTLKAIFSKSLRFLLELGLVTMVVKDNNNEFVEAPNRSSKSRFVGLTKEGAAIFRL